MKKKLLPLLFVAALHGQEPTGEHAELLDPIVKIPVAPIEPAPEPQRLEVPPEDIISTKVIIRNGQKFTIQKVEPQELEPLPEPPPPRFLTAEEESARAARIAARGAHRNLMFSCTVYNGEKTMIRWNSQGRHSGLSRCVAAGEVVCVGKEGWIEADSLCRLPRLRDRA